MGPIKLLSDVSSVLLVLIRILKLKPVWSDVFINANYFLKYSFIVRVYLNTKNVDEAEIWCKPTL